MGFCSICFLLCYYKITFFVVFFFDIAVEAVVFIDLVINIHREFVHSLVVST